MSAPPRGTESSWPKPADFSPGVTLADAALSGSGRTEAREELGDAGGLLVGERDDLDDPARVLDDGASRGLTRETDTHQASAGHQAAPTDVDTAKPDLGLSLDPKVSALFDGGEIHGRPVHSLSSLPIWR